LAPEGLVCGGRDQRGAAVPAPPWHLRPMRNRPPSCCGARADGPWLRCPRHTHGGKEVGPNRADAWRSLKATMHCCGARACMAAVLGETPGKAAQANVLVDR
jgi:hypothetical protein